MFFLRQMRQAASSFSTSAATYGSYHGRSNSFNNQPAALIPYFIVCSMVGSYFNMKRGASKSITHQEDTASPSERTSPRKLS